MTCDRLEIKREESGIKADRDVRFKGRGNIKSSSKSENEDTK